MSKFVNLCRTLLYLSFQYDKLCNRGKLEKYGNKVMADDKGV